MMKLEHNYHMIITNQNDYKIDLKNNFVFVGFPDRNRKTIQTMKPGDKIIFYILKKSVFMAVVEVTGNYFYSEEKHWSDDFDLWPHRIKTKPLVFIDDFVKGIYIKEIWDNLDFITNKTKWGSQVMGSYRKISRNDFNIIFNAIKERSN